MDSKENAIISGSENFASLSDKSISIPNNSRKALDQKIAQLKRSQKLSAEHLKE